LPCLDQESSDLVDCRYSASDESQPDTVKGLQIELILAVEQFQPEKMNVRMSGEQPSYSRVLTVSGIGKIVYTASQRGLVISTAIALAKVICAPRGNRPSKISTDALKAGGATWADVVKTHTFVTDFDEFQKCADVGVRYLGVATPTSTTVSVTRLASPDFMIQIKLVAVVNSGARTPSLRESSCLSPCLADRQALYGYCEPAAPMAFR
jgi:enamine deaminase RidA (YjgF/YER057c/UK114 family)